MWSLNWLSFLNYAHKTHKTKKIKKTFFSNTYAFIWAWTRGDYHVLIGCTHDLVGSENTFKCSSEKLILICWVMVLLKRGFTSMVTIKIFEPLKWEFQKGNRRLILNMVTKIRNLIVKSITAGRGWCKSRKVVLMQKQIFLGHFKEAHSMKASHHPREPSTKIAAVLYQLSYEDPYFSSKPIFLLLFLIREENETWNKDNVNCRNTRYDRHSCNSILSNCKLTQINLRNCNAIPPLFWLWSWIPIQFLRQYEI